MYTCERAVHGRDKEWEWKALQTVFASKIHHYICNIFSGAMNPTTQGPARSTVTAEPFLNGSSGVYIEKMYGSWLEVGSWPSSVRKSWDVFFPNVEASAIPRQAFQSSPALSHVTYPALRPPSVQLVMDKDINQAIHDHLRVKLLIRSYQTRGHNIADLDPLVINSADMDDTIPRELELDFYGFTESDLDREFVLLPTTFIGDDRARLTLREIVDRIKAIYCHHTGVEYMRLTNYDQQESIRRHFEAQRVTELTPAQKKLLFKRLMRSTKFEDCRAKDWPSEKRFGLEGYKVLIPRIEQVTDRSSALGVDSIVIAMPHRGRLNLKPRTFLQPPQQRMCLRFSSESADMKTKYITSLAIPEEDKHYLGLVVDKLTQEKHQAEKAHLKECHLKELKSEQEKAELKFKSEQEKAELKFKSEQEKAELKLKYETEILNLKLAYKTKEYLELYQIYTPRALLERFEGLHKNPRLAYESREKIWTRAMDQNREFAKCIERNGIKREEVPQIAMRLYSTLSTRVHGKFTKLSVNDQGQVEVEVVNISLAEKKLYQCAAQVIGYELVIKGPSV
uniref:2-oxoglutarate dehydrogenase, mitochondrial n=1 Tax=Ditylenchus dipsaci TaxID=166011 RepID=A0A915DTG7_9BILA